MNCDPSFISPQAAVLVFLFGALLGSFLEHVFNAGGGE